MVAKQYYDILLKITDVMEEKGGGIIYIRNEPDCYTIGTRYYDEEIAKYLDDNVDNWSGEESTLKKKSKKRDLLLKSLLDFLNKLLKYLPYPHHS
jgi:hypothetical protein